MNDMWVTALCWIWTLGTAVLAVLFMAAFVVSVVLATKRKRLAFIGIGAASLLAVAVSVVANPIANLFIFHRVADRNTDQMIVTMRARCPVGHDAQDLVAIFGHPNRTRTVGDRDIWTYDPNPWWMTGWTEIEVGVVSNKIQGHWLED